LAYLFYLKFSLDGPRVNPAGFHCSNNFTFQITNLPPKFSVRETLAFAPVISQSLQAAAGELAYFPFANVFVALAHTFCLPK
jgi:hypothetical protein